MQVAAVKRYSSDIKLAPQKTSNFPSPLYVDSAAIHGHSFLSAGFLFSQVGFFIRAEINKEISILVLQKLNRYRGRKTDEVSNANNVLLYNQFPSLDEVCF